MAYLLYAVALFTSAALLFVIQPMAARLLQPALGGTPAVWNTAMVFFQATLLGGYLYAHLTTRWLGTRKQALLHLVVMALGLVFLPIAIEAPTDPSDLASPVLWLVTTLCLAIGWPVFVVATSAPLLQKWFSDLHHWRSADPYHLYAASNLGSVLALLAYPLFIEPRLGLSAQSVLWAAAYLTLCAAVAFCAALLWRSPQARPTTSETAETPPAATKPLTWRRRARWLVWAFIPSSLMLSITTFLTTDLAPAPLLWIPPLAIYLLSFIAAFARKRPIPQMWWIGASPFILAILAILLATDTVDPLILVGAAKLFALLVLAMAFHGSLADDRPATGQLTEFYLLMAVGGVLGGLFTALVAPLAFDTYLEYPLVLALAAFALPLRKPRLLRGFSKIVAVGLVVIVAISALPDAEELHRERSFFGTHRVVASTGGGFHLLYHGQTLHGAQAVDDDSAHIPLMYYHPTGPLGQVFAHLETGRERHPIAAIGLGAGSIATYVVEDQIMEFFEIDPQVIALAKDPELFTYLERCRGECRITEGDGRVLTAAAEDERYELIVVDAYSSAAVPVHLLTRQAIATYVQKLHPKGIVAIHISSPYLDLEPPLTRAIHDLGLVSRVQRHDLAEDSPLFHQYVDSSEWLIVARQEEALGPLAADPRWLALEPEPDVRAWTDDYANLLDVWRR